MTRLAAVAAALAVIGLRPPVTTASQDPASRWERVVETAAFEGRDSSANAALAFRAAMWILAGWRHNGTDYVSVADVWRSVDGHEWSRINAAPPYHPYSAFVVFRGAMWAIKSDSYRSTDGIRWDRAGTPPFSPARVTTLDGRLWAIDEAQRVWNSRDGTKWTMVTATTPWTPRELPGFHGFAGRLWMFGGSAGYNTPQEHHLNDVWWSRDGKSWTCATPAAPWPARYWFNSAVYDDRLWIIGGWRRADNVEEKNWGNRADVWWSADGVHWSEQLPPPGWSPRHAPLTWVTPRGLWLAAGFGGGGPERLFRDVWRMR